MLLAAKGERSYIPITTETPLYESEVIMPIVSEGDAIGSVVMLGQEPMQESDKTLVMTAAGFLGTANGRLKQAEGFSEASVLLCKRLFRKRIACGC